MLKSIVLALMSMLLSCSAMAQEGLEQLSPFATGAGRTYAVTPRGLDATGLNPALLALGTPRRFEISLIPISSFGVNAGPSFTQINSISKGFQGGALASQDPTVDSSISKGDSIRGSMSNLLANSKLSSTANARLFGLSYYDPEIGSFALTLSTHAALRVSLPDAMLNYIGLVGFLSRFVEGVKLSPQQLDIQGLWYSEYTLSYGRNIMGETMSGQPQLLAGLGVKYVSGIAMMRIDPSSTFSINYPSQPGGQAKVAVNYQIDYAYPSVFDPNHLPNGFSTNLLAKASAGSGLGADIGFTFGSFDSSQRSPWQLGLSISDIGSIKWTANTLIRTADTVVVITGSSASNKDTINGQLKALGGNLKSTGSITTLLPTTLHIAGALDLSEIGITIAGGRIGVAAEYALGLTDVVGSPNNGRFGFGATLDMPSSFISFHTALGYTTQDGVTGLTFAIGCGIGNRVLLDLGTSGLGQVFQPSETRDVIFDLKVLF